MFRSDGDVLATLRFDDLLNFLRENKDLQKHVEMLRTPNAFDVINGAGEVVDTVQASPTVDQLTKDKIERGAKHCRNNHLSDEYGYCNIVDCKYSRGYRKPKEKRRF